MDINLNSQATATRPPTLKLDSRRTSISVEDVNSYSGGSSPDNNNYLSVSGSMKPQRRHSDNAINIPKIEIALSSPTTTENKLIARASSTMNLANRRHSSTNTIDIQQLGRRRHSSINLTDLQQFNRRRHSAINPHDIKRVANKISHAADDMLTSAASSIVSIYMYTNMHKYIIILFLLFIT